MARRRLDAELVHRGLAVSRQQAAELVAGGQVLVKGSVAVKTSALVAAGDAVAVNGPVSRFVSRGGDKLAHALDRFSVRVSGRCCLDVGASTGGFTDCLLQRGAASVVAVDSGHGQLHPRLRGDSRVTVLERTNARHLVEMHPELLARAGVVVADVSFISLRVLVPVLIACAEPVAPDAGGGAGADMVLLVKPQFEAGRAEVSRGRGVVRAPEARRQAVDTVAGALQAAGTTVVGVTASPLLGPAGNAEFFLHAQLLGPPGAPLAPDAVWRAVAEAPGPDRPRVSVDQ